MSYTSRDYKAIAQAIRETWQRYQATHGAGASKEIAESIGIHFAQSSPTFDAARFARDCEPK